MTTPALEAVDVTRSYALEGGEVQALRGVSLTIDRGDYAAVVGPSGSGKSTLMHLLGGLDRPTTGILRVGGRDIASLSEDELASVRNATIGFVFQAFQLLGRTSAVDNVGMPLVYRGVKRSERRRRAAEALERVGMGHRLGHRPAQLSGGEQQRVAIARALVGDPQVLLADEPTGNLDTRTGEEVMALLEQLNAEQGVAVVLVTHDLDVAARARRQIRVRDGLLEPDRRARGCRSPTATQAHRVRLAEAWRVAVTALRANRLRSLLTMLGVVIGVAAVVVLVAIGTGAKQEVEEQVNGLGANLVIIVPGRLDFGSAPTKSRLELSDATRIERATGQEVAVSLASGETVRFGGQEAFATVNGTNAAVADVFVRPVERGEYLRETDIETRRRVAVIGPALVTQLFDGADPLGRTISVGGVRFRVIGVFEEVGSSTFGGSRDSEVHIPVTAAQRLFGDMRVDAFALKAPSTETIDEVSDQALAVLADRYPDEEFSAVTQDQILGTVGRILGLLTTVLAAIAAISLLVGGVGVSNIMLVSVRERTREIGLRKAVGARQRDVTLQFLIEAVLLTTIGGVIGIALGVGGSLGLSAAVDQLPAVITWWSPALAFTVSAAVGIFFGVVPARRAGRLDPVAALRTE